MQKQKRASPMGVFGDDLVKGADAIAEFIFGDSSRRRAVYNLADPAKGNVRLPTFHLCGFLCARKSQLKTWAESLAGTVQEATSALPREPETSGRRGRGRPRKAA